MANLKELKGYIRGGSYIVIWYSSILLGFFFLFAPLLPLLLISRPLYRRVTDIIFSTWAAFNTSLLELVYGVELILTGDGIQETDNAIITVNHPTRTDWNFVWPALFHASPSFNAKFVLKHGLRTVPGMGWIMSMSRFIYLKRNWAEDSLILDRMMNYYTETKNDGARQIVLFPEGTNLTDKTKAKSDSFAEKNNLPKYKHVLHPRTAGFVHLAHGLQERGMITAIYDFTVAYSERRPETEMELLRGAIPTRVHVHVTRYPVQRVPTTFVGLEKWIQEVWREKERKLGEFYDDENGKPVSSLVPFQKQPCIAKTLQPFCLVGFLCFLYFSFTSLLTLTCPKLWVVAVSAFVVCLEKYGFGLQNLELELAEKGLFGLLTRSRSRPTAPTAEGEVQDDFEHLKHE